MSKKKVVKFKEIDEFFKDYEFTDDEIELSECETITDIEKFIKSHIAIIEGNQNRKIDARRRLIPYWNRLLKMYKLLNLNWEKHVKI